MLDHAKIEETIRQMSISELEKEYDALIEWAANVDYNQPYTMKDIYNGIRLAMVEERMMREFAPA